MRCLLRSRRGNMSVELALIASVLMPVCLIGGQRVGPALLDWAQDTYRETVAARDALDALCAAMADADIRSTACPAGQGE
jgi:hypothetical protein